jgi:hypothetical protein
MTMRCEVRPQAAAAESVAHAVRTRTLPSLVAFYSQDLTLLACTDDYTAPWGTTPDAVCGRSVTEILPHEDADRLVPHLLRCVLGATVHLRLRPPLGATHARREQLTLVPYVVDGEQLGVAVLQDDASPC